MLKLEDTGAKIITKEEFCTKTKIQVDHWIFGFAGQKPRFWMYKYHDVDNPERYYYYDDNNCIREFKHMKKHGETWAKVYFYRKTAEGKKGTWSVWYTWEVW